VNRRGERGQMRYANPLDIDCLACCRNLRSLICSNFGLAATHLFHVAALPVHYTAASTFLMTPHHVGDTGHNWRSCAEE